MERNREATHGAANPTARDAFRRRWHQGPSGTIGRSQGAGGRAVNEGADGGVNEAAGGVKERVEEKWQTVPPKKRSLHFAQERKVYDQGKNNQWRREERKNLSTRGFASFEIEQAYAKAFNERRCFRCLSKEHRRAECREPMRCFKCQGNGHNSGRCKVGTKPPIRKELHAKPNLQIPTGGKSYAEVTILKKPQENHTPNTTVPAKQRVVRKVMDQLEDVRPEESHVYMSGREGLRPQNQSLIYTGMIVMMQGAPTMDLLQEIPRHLSQRFGGEPRHYEVYDGPPEEDAPFVIISC